MNKTNNLRAYLRDLYEGIVSKKPDASRNPQNFRSEIEAIRTGGEFYEVMDASELPEDAPDGSLAIVEVEDGTGGGNGGGVVVCNAETIKAIEILNAIKGLTISCPNAKIIYASAFNGCTSLTSIDLPNVRTVDTFAFEGCTSLKSIDLPNATSIGNSAFDGCTSLTSVDLPNARTVGNSAFYGCTSLTSINVPSVIRIYDWAFVGCTSLKSIDLPNIRNVDGCAFEGCTNLDTLILRNTAGCEIILTALLGTKIVTAEGVPTGEGFVYVPTALYEQYVAMLVAQVMQEGYDEATATYLVTAVLRKIEDYPEICGA